MERVYKLVLLFLLVPTICLGAVNEKYSYKDFMNINFVKLDAKEFNNSTIIGTNFYQFEKVKEDIFPDGLVNVIFEKCNMDNVLIKSGMTVDDTNSKRLLKIQQDMEVWVLDESLNPVEPIDKQKFIDLGISIEPKDIPLIIKDISITEEKEREKESLDAINR